ncbi:MAG: outer membrane beta-barrel protein [Muribaculaceae bacterium]|nr:outer membrane beta-barrel protein [Muribaculaceae bacterium]
MKRIFLLVAAFAILACQSVSAQTTIDPTADYNRATLMYQHRSFDGTGTNGFELGYIHGFSLSKTVPLFFQTGLKLDMGFSSDDADVSGVKVTGKLKTMSLNVPLDLSYKLVFGESKTAAFVPYAGFNLKLNTMGKMTAKASYSGVSASESTSLFDAGMKHFQIGWHIGLGLQINKVFVGADFGTDFIKIADGGNHTPTFHIGLGYTF